MNFAEMTIEEIVRYVDLARAHGDDEAVQAAEDYLQTQPKPVLRGELNIELPKFAAKDS